MYLQFVSPSQESDLLEVVMSQAGEVGPCSAWLTRSVARIQGSAVLSAMMPISVGPAIWSIPTWRHTARHTARDAI